MNGTEREPADAADADPAERAREPEGKSNAK